MAHTSPKDIPDSDNLDVFHLNAKGGEHPDRRDGETLLGYRNATGLAILKAQSRLETLRKGERVIDDFERERTADAAGEFFPVFAQTAELGALPHPG